MWAAGIKILLYQSQEEFIEIVWLYVCNRVNKSNSFLNVSLDANIFPPPPKKEHFPSVCIISPKYLFELF